MSKITLDNLSDNLKEYLNGLGLSEEQVLNLINENGLDEEELKAMLKDTMSINELSTNSKTVIGAINELFQNANNGKQLIANAIGNELITVDSTFSAMSEAILGLRRESENETDAREVLYNMMIEDGYDEANSEMTVDELIELLDDSQIEIGDIKQIACGYIHTVILKNDGSVWSCGDNGEGQLGLGDTTTYKSFTQVTTNINNDVKQIACGDYYTFIIKNDGSVWSCGYNGYGQLGLGNTTNRTTFTKVTTNINNDVKQIACGAGFMGISYTFILKNDGSVWSCGDNTYGQLGLNDTTDRNTFTQVTTNINNDVKQIVCGYRHTVILKNDGSVWSCGFNDSGELGLGDNTDRTTFTQVTTNINNDVKQIACGEQHVFIIKNDGSVWSCGANGKGQLGLGDNTNRNTFTQVNTNINNDVKQIVCGYYYTYILKNDGSVWSCGDNDYGQLGLGNTTDKTTFTKVTANINNDVKQISCGNVHTFILKNDVSVWSCGGNDYGQLGLNDTNNRTTFTQVPLSSQSIDEYEINRQKLYYYLLDNSIEVNESMDIGTMLDLLVDDYINNLILGYENNLRIILTDEGVSVNDEDNMDSLITKVDEEFNDRSNEMSSLNTNITLLTNQVNSLTNELAGKVTPAGTAVASNVLTGKTFINSTGSTLTGTMTNNGIKTITPKASAQTLGAGYYDKITINGDADLVAANIVSGKNIFGVTGTASTSLIVSVEQKLSLYKVSSGTINVTFPTGLSKINKLIMYFSAYTEGGDNYGKNVYILYPDSSSRTLYSSGSIYFRFSIGNVTTSGMTVTVECSSSVDTRYFEVHKVYIM